jgi:hypothetical protein
VTRRIKTKFQGKELFLALDSEADESVYEEIFVDRDYRLLDEYFKKAKLIVDIGAHIGLFSLYASVMAPAAKIISYEPEESNYAKLKGPSQGKPHPKCAVKKSGSGWQRRPAKACD